MGQQQAIAGTHMLGESRVPCFPGLRFDTRTAGDLHALDYKGDITHRSFAQAMFGPVIGFGMQTVMNVNSAQGGQSVIAAKLGKTLKEDHRIHATGQPQAPGRGVHAGRRAMLPGHPVRPATEP